MTDVIAVDWSGRARGAAEHIWLARVRHGRLDELDNGMGREALIDRIVALCRRRPRTVVGLDFAFSFPAWFIRRRGWRSAREVWRAMTGEEVERLLSGGPPFWGRAGSVAQLEGPPLRVTEAQAPGAPKSVFQIAGAGAVGTGSLRGMGHLADLAAAGFSIWPFDEPRWPRVVEIYPRLFTAGAIKSRHRARRTWLAGRFGEQDPVLLERAAGSEDAFDAAVSALVMARHLDELAALRQAPAGDPRRIEGAIWIPRASP